MTQHKEMGESTYFVQIGSWVEKKQTNKQPILELPGKLGASYFCCDFTSQGEGFSYIDAHAGGGLYDLSAEESQVFCNFQA